MCCTSRTCGLRLPGALSLVLVPWISSMFGQRALLELLSRAQARAQSPAASAEDVRADLAELRRVLSTYRQPAPPHGR